MASPPQMLITGISHLVLEVSDLDRSVAWYVSALGLHETTRAPGRYVGLESASAGFRLSLKAGGQPGMSGALDHVAFSVPGPEALSSWVEHLDALGLAHEGIKPNPFGHSIDLFDPDGINIELVSEE